MGLFEMYKLTIEHTKREILTVFRVMMRHDNYPVSIFCSLGKDRTGIISALLLSCLGVPRDLILDDYHETEIHIQPSIENISRYFSRIGLTNPEFVQAPKEVMSRLLEYLDTTYGGTKEYLNSIGFSYEDQQLLSAVLTEEKSAENGASLRASLGSSGCATPPMN